MAIARSPLFDLDRNVFESRQSLTQGVSLEITQNDYFRDIDQFECVLTTRSMMCVLNTLFTDSNAFFNHNYTSTLPNIKT